MTMVIQLVILILSVIVHEIAHGYVAYRFGDPTAKQLGRLSLNPISHIDPIGSVLLPVIFVLTGSPIFLGWAKPVPVNPRYFRNPLVDMMYVALAGPLVNITIALCASVGFKLVVPLSSGLSILPLVLAMTVQINIVLAVFNLIPIPPLDGSRVLAVVLLPRMREWLYRVEPYGILIVLGFAYFGVFDAIFSVVLPPILAFLLPVG